MASKKAAYLRAQTEKRLRASGEWDVNKEASNYIKKEQAAKLKKAKEPKQMSLLNAAAAVVTGGLSLAFGW